MKPLTLEETKLKEEIKERCIAKGQYKDKNAKAKFNMLCHLEDFEIQYWELQKENKQLKEELEYTIGIVEHNRIISEKNKEIHQLKDNWNKLKEYIKETKLKEFEKEYGKRYGKTFTQAELIVCNMILDKMQELEQGSDNK